MRLLLILVTAAVLLAGCTDDPVEPGSPDDTDPAPTGATGPGTARGTDKRSPAADSQEGPSGQTTEVLEGTLTWHSRDTQGVGVALTAAAQPIVNECVSNANGEVGDTNLDLLAGPAALPVPDGVTALEVTFEWETTDYVKDRLVLAYQPEGDTVMESGWIPRGQATIVDVDADVAAGAWGFWACVSKEGATTATDPSEGPKAFVGDLSFKIVAHH